MRNVTGLLFLVILAAGLSLGATNGTNANNSGLMPMRPDTTGPDAWGYTAVRSTDPGGPVFNWVNITTRGTLATGLLDDNAIGPIDMLFNFPYYWYTANRFKIGSNGYIQFDVSNTAFASPFAACPNAAAPNDLMAICVGDLVFAGQAGAAGQCYYWTNGSDSLVVSFLNVTEWESTINANTRHTFQVILNRADSSITYQYGLQQGRYNTTNNHYLSIGIENATGQLGLNYAYTAVGPHPLLPDSGFAIRIKRTVNTGLQVTDAGIVGGFNASNLAKMVNVGVADTIKCVVRNFGTAAITNAPVRYAITKTGQPSAFDTVVVPSLAAGDQITVTFPRLFTPAVTGPYSALFNVTVAGDVGPSNNSKTAELTSNSFTLGQKTLLSYETGTISGNLGWTGGGGYGIAFDLPSSAYPVRIESVYVSVSSITVQPMTVQILDGSSGSPGTVLAQKTNITAVAGMNGIDFTSDSVRISSGRFFVGATGQIFFNYESTAPISYRTWEYTGGWNPYRQADQQDYIIRATVRREAPRAVTYASEWAAPATYPDLPAVTYFQAAEWLGDTLFVQAPSTAGAGATTVYKYSIGGGWTSGVGLPAAKVGGTLTKCANKLYYIGGGSASITTGTTDVYEFDPATQNWTSKAPVPIAISGHKAVCWGDSVIFVIGGPYTGSGTNLDVQVYRPGSNTWSTIASSLPAAQGRRTFAAGISGNKIIISSGFNTAFLKTTWVGTINSAASISWVAAPDVPTIYTGLSRPGGVAYGDKFYIVCGERAGAGGYYDTTHVYSISSNSWTGIIRNKPIKMSNIFNAVTAKLVNDTVKVFVPGGFGSVTGATPGIAYATFDVINGGPGLTAVDDEISNIPGAFRLEQNYPNPFNPSTNIRYGLSRAAHVSVRIYNLLGQEVAQLKDEVESAGTHDVVWFARNTAGHSVASGVYFYQLEARPVDGSAPFNSFKKMLLLK